MAKLPIRESRRGREGILVRAQEANGEIRWPAYRLHTRGAGGLGCRLVGSQGTPAHARSCTREQKNSSGCHAEVSPQKKQNKNTNAEMEKHN